VSPRQLDNLETCKSGLIPTYAYRPPTAAHCHSSFFCEESDQ